MSQEMRPKLRPKETTKISQELKPTSLHRRHVGLKHLQTYHHSSKEEVKHSRHALISPYAYAYASSLLRLPLEIPLQRTYLWVSRKIGKDYSLQCSTGQSMV